MNSYELDQPLDLRLKALNLSRSYHQDMPVLPVRSHSMSGQMIASSHLSLMVSPTLTPPSSIHTPSMPAMAPIQQMPPVSYNTPAPSHHYKLSPSCHSPMHRPSNLCDNTFSCNSIANYPRCHTGCLNEAPPPRISPPLACHQPAARIPTPNNSQAQQRKNINQSPRSSPTSSDTAGGGTTSPIMRQHSLVSRYNCKPCGIVFSQPETLRAHQEGYCTKTNRAQLRSQSAVSPSSKLQL